MLPALWLLAAPLSVSAQDVPAPFVPDSLAAKPVIPMPGSVDLVTEARMNKGLVTSSLSALSGQAAGVNISSGENRMAQLSAVRVRGTTSLTGGNDPLVIIDGVYADIATLTGIYPADIESFSILKNAAETAQYGSRGASGVILVTTKKGSGAQFHISYDGNVGFESKYKTLDMLDGPAYTSTLRALGLEGIDGGYNTNFQDAITRTGFVMRHHVAFSGGSDKSSYRASLGTMTHNTIIDTKGSRSFVAKLDLSQHAFDDLLRVEFGVLGSTQKTDGIFDAQGLFYSAAAQNPTYAADAMTKNGAASQINPPRTLLKERDDNHGLSFNTHLRLEATLPLGLKLSVMGAYSFSSVENAQFCPTWVWAQGQAYRGEHKSEEWFGNLALDWHHAYGAHDFKATLMGEYQKRRRTGFWTLVKGFTTNEFGYHNLGAASTRPFGGTGSDYEAPALGSVMANAAYTLARRYAVALTLRADGSTLVGDNHTWGVFPSVSASWDVKEEPFMRHARRVSMLRMRVGYGTTGNLGAIDAYTTLNAVEPVGLVSVGGTPTVTLGTLRNTNPDLKWETRSTFNIGADIGLFDNRLLLTAEYYYSKTTDMLYQYDVPVPPFAFDKLLANVGSMSNSGVEVGIGITPIRHRDLELNVNLNLSWQRNKLLSLSGDYNGTHLSAPRVTAIGSLNGAGFHGGNSNILYQIIGQPLGVFYLPHCTGIVDNGHGHYRYEIADLDDNGTVDLSDDGDRYIAGQATPRMTLGSNISLRYKDFDLSVQVNGAFGHKIYNGTTLSYLNMSSFPDYNVMADAPARNIVDQNVTDYWLERGDYLNIDYLTLGWNVPVRSRYISGLRLSCSVNNLATITGYSGLTPMVNSYIVDSTLGIDDKRSYPIYRTYSIGVSVQF